MIKFEKASDDVINLFETIRDKTTIPQWVKFEVLNNNKQNELYKIVKMNDFVETLTDGINFVVIFNKEILEQLTKDYQEMAVNDCLACVCVTETSSIYLEKPKLRTYLGILEKYGDDPVVALYGEKQKKT
jgi:hypothetical protein